MSITLFVSWFCIMLMLMDPIGNTPTFNALLSTVQPGRRTRILARECTTACCVLLFFVFFGKWAMDILQVTEGAISIAGGITLFFIASRMVFKAPDEIFEGDPISAEPLIVPIAIPLIAGPSAIAMVMLWSAESAGDSGKIFSLSAAVMVASTVNALVLILFGLPLARLLGARGMLAAQRLVGLVLTAVAVEMTLKGVRGFVGTLQ